MTVNNETSTIPVYDDIDDPKANNSQDTEHYKDV